MSILKKPATREALNWPALGVWHECGQALEINGPTHVVCTRCKMRFAPARIRRYTDEEIGQRFYTVVPVITAGPAPYRLVEVTEGRNRFYSVRQGEVLPDEERAVLP